MRVVLAMVVACGCGPPVGTNPGSMIVDLVPGPGSSTPGSFRRVGNRVYFATFNTRIGTWRTDGTSEGTEQVSDVPLFVVDAGGGDGWGVDISGGSGVFWIPEGGLAERVGDGAGVIAAVGGRAVAPGPDGLMMFEADGTTTLLDGPSPGQLSFQRVGDTIYGCRAFGGGAFVVDFDEPGIDAIAGSSNCTLIGAVGDVALAIADPQVLQRVTGAGVRTLVTDVCCGVLVADDAAYMVTGVGNDVWVTDGNVATKLADDAAAFGVIGAVNGRVVVSASPDLTVSFGPDGREVLSPSQSWIGVTTPRGLWYWDGIGQRWITDGTADGTHAMAPLPGMSSSELVTMRDLVFYAGFDCHGLEPWVAEMSAADALPLPDAGSP